MTNHKCDMHEKEIKKMREQLDEIFIRLNKPVFTDKQIAGMLMTIVVYLVFSVNYINGINAQSTENANDIKESKAMDEKIINLLIEIKEDVATNNANIKQGH